MKIIQLSCLLLLAIIASSQNPPKKSKLLQGLVQVGCEIPSAFRDRLGTIASVGFIFDEQVVYKFTYLKSNENTYNQEHSIDILLSKYQKSKQVSIGGAYYISSNSKDIILPTVSFYNFHFYNTNFGYNIKLGFSLQALGYGLPIASPILQLNVSYIISKH